MSLSCIIPAYNEGARIEAVLATALVHPLIDEVIVVDDGSSDDTALRVASYPRATLIRQPQNAGKTRAVATGLRAAKGDHILLLDADLIGLRPTDLEALIAPVLAGRADAAISLRGNAPRPWHWLGVDYISGERVAPRAALMAEIAALERLPRFGLEVFMNRLWIARGWRVAVISWPEVRSPMKAAKRGGFWRGLRADLAMLGDMFRVISPLEAWAQIRAMRRARIRRA